MPFERKLSGWNGLGSAARPADEVGDTAIRGAVWLGEGEGTRRASARVFAKSSGVGGRRRSPRVGDSAANLFGSASRLAPFGSPLCDGRDRDSAADEPFDDDDEDEEEEDDDDFFPDDDDDDEDEADDDDDELEFDDDFE